MRRRTATLGTIGLVVAACALTAGGQDELPPLTAPLEVSIPDDPEPKPEPEPKAAESRRPVLMVPGLPRPRSRVVAKPVVDEAELPSLDPIDEGLPPLVGPADELPEMELDPEPTQEPAPDLDLPDDAPPPLTLEAEPSDAEHAPGATVATPKQPARPVPAPRRRLFGLLPPLRPRNDPRPATSPKIEFDPRSDPAADAALKQRVERVIRQSAGPHVRAADVSVIERSIVIRARVDRFFNRRSVKRRLESLPGLAGYQTRVEIVD
jgi:hypothetical protein